MSPSVFIKTKEYEKCVLPAVSLMMSFNLQVPWLMSVRIRNTFLERFLIDLDSGVTTEHIDRRVHDMIIRNGGYPSTLNYKGFPKSICTSVNEVTVHGIPDTRPLHDGDIVTVDVTVFLDGYHGDCAKTFLIGNVDQHARRLVQVSPSQSLRAL